jgi:Uncharacterized conserved protein, COG2445
MVRPDVIRKRLEKLDEYLAILRQLQKYSYDEFVSNPERYGSAERFLQLAIESINDLGNHVVAESGLGNVDWYSDIPHRLREGGLIDASQEETWIKMIGFRNILVHDYLTYVPHFEKTKTDFAVSSGVEDTYGRDYLCDSAVGSFGHCGRHLPGDRAGRTD